MSSLPPRLLYLIIYNPSLKPLESTQPDDEDAQEQAHVLFYTANDHAVSKDRVLRQVGLAKALANFTTIFDPRVSCDSVHSQSRRMIVLSPEPNFWIHACFELEKVVRATKSRKEDKNKAKQKEPVYDYNEASLHDAALQTQLSLGYDAFKMIHGSFTSIYNRKGKEALELQLERFFTVWAWSHDFGRHISFAEYLGKFICSLPVAFPVLLLELGIRVHPLSTQLVPLIDVLEDKMPPHYSPVVLISSCLVVLKASPPQCPPALARHLLRILEARTSRRPSSTPTVPTEDPPVEDQSIPALSSNEQKHARSASSTFLGVPGLAMNVNMDMRKWNWSGYLTFGMGSSSVKPKSDHPEARIQGDLEESETQSNLDKTEVNPESHIDSQALQDALASEGDTGHSTAIEETELRTSGASPDVNYTNLEERGSNPDLPIVSDPQDERLTEVPISKRPSVSSTKQPSLGILPSPSFTWLRVQLPDSDPLVTRPRIIRYLCMDNILFALVPTTERTDDDLDDMTCQDLAERCVELIDRLKEIVEVEEEKIASAFSSSPVQSVLQKSQHVITTTDQLTYSSTSFTATSWHLHEGKKALELYPDLQEIYSRGQNPQDWHLAKRGLGGNVVGDVYMEIGRKEASLVDVDSEISGVLRRFTE